MRGLRGLRGFFPATQYDCLSPERPSRVARKKPCKPRKPRNLTSPHERKQQAKGRQICDGCWDDPNHNVEKVKLRGLP
jgi:hypothetical protein